MRQGLSKRAGSQAYQNQNQGGGVKKQGLASTIGIDASVSAIYGKRLGCLCDADKNRISTTKSCQAGVGGIRRFRC
jgi:hypothetical protein